MNTKVLTRWRLIPGTCRQWRIEYKRADEWLGRYVDGSDTWICIIPCFPIHLQRIKNLEDSVNE